MTVLVPMPAHSLQLNEFTKDEWRDVARLVKPELTDEQYDRMWTSFQKMKGRKRLQ